MTMTKNDIVDALCEKLYDVSKKEAAAIVAALFDTIGVVEHQGDDR